MATETPNSDRFLIYQPYRFGWANDMGGSECRRAAAGNRYRLGHLEEPVAGLRPRLTLPRFRQRIGRGYGVVHVETHGSRNGIAVEAYERTPDGKRARDAAYRRYNAQPMYRGKIYRGSSAHGYHVGVRAAGLSAWFTDRKSMVFLASCKGSALNASWGAKDAIGYNLCPRPARVRSDAAKIYRRMRGRLDRGTKNKRRELRDAHRGVNGALVRSGPGDSVLAPSVVRCEPHATMRCQTILEGFVEFDSSMDTTVDPGLVVNPRGCNLSLYRLEWDGDTRVKFRVYPRICPSSATFTVFADQATSRNNGILLDGNRDPANTSGVVPNRDDFVWEVRCLAKEERENGKKRRRRRPVD